MSNKPVVVDSTKDSRKRVVEDHNFAELDVDFPIGLRYMSMNEELRLTTTAPIYTCNMFIANICFSAAKSAHGVAGIFLYFLDECLAEVKIKEFAAKDDVGNIILRISSRTFTKAQNSVMVNCSGIWGTERTTKRVRCTGSIEYCGNKRIRVSLSRGEPSSETAVFNRYAQLLFSKQRSDFELKIFCSCASTPTSIPAHSFILQTQLKYFETLFGSNMSETLTKSTEIRDFCVETIRGLLSFAYTGSTKEFAPKNIERAIDFIHAADYFGCELLERSVEKLIAEREWVKKENLPMVLELCLQQKTDLKQLRKAAVAVLFENYEDQELMNALKDRNIGFYVDLLLEGREPP
ncbi:hypothetical protein BJ742DRAFT_799587 [Cladochytrium replicatum]|nr:hypothetical protein BJ742DRAFT_799587 [Cladochytrium replicatum]